MTINSYRKGSFSIHTERFTKADRVRKTPIYNEISTKGRRCHSQYFILVYKQNQLKCNRLGITVSRKVGKAVVRNKIKRIIREYFRLNRDGLPRCVDVNIIARPSAGKSEPIAIRKDLKRGYKKLSAQFPEA